VDPTAQPWLGQNIGTPGELVIQYSSLARARIAVKWFSFPGNLNSGYTIPLRLKEPLYRTYELRVRPMPQIQLSPGAGRRSATATGSVKISIPNPSLEFGNADTRNNAKRPADTRHGLMTSPS
jgi:hypothetical protein